MVPAVHSSRQIYSVDSLLFKGIGSRKTSCPTSTVNKISVFFLELTNAILQITEGDVLGPRDVGKRSLKASSNINHFEIRVVLVLFNHFLGLLWIDTHIFCRENIIKQEKNTRVSKEF